jgi:RHS repeat-associated protein
MLAQTAGAATDHFVHGPAGVLSQRDSAGGWEWPLADGLGSVRSVAGSANAVLETRAYDPYGQPLSSTGTPQTPFGFTGELADANGLLYLRARHYAPRLGAFPSLDPYEGSAARPMSLNGYAWVEGQVADGRDPSGSCPENPGPLDVFGWRCRFLAEGLAARTGSPVENFMWMDYGQLELLTALGTAADVGGELRQGLDNATMVTQLFLQNPSVTLQALNQALGGCAGAGVTLGSIIHRGESNLQIGLLLVGAALVAGTFLLAYGAIRDATGSAIDQAERVVENYINNPPTNTPYLQPNPNATPTPRRANMRVQLQEQRGPGNTIHHASTPIYDLTGAGVTTSQVILELQLLRLNPVITRREQAQADSALQDAIGFVLRFPPYG